MIIDLRSDTVTKPTPAMLEAMFAARVGDDVYEEDPTVNELEAKTAALFGMEAGLFCPSGTMTNQIAIKLLTQPGDEVICDRLAHIYNYEGGGIAFNSLASVRLLDGDRGRITPEQVEENINADNIHYPRTSMVALENTVNKGGGCYYTIPQIAALSNIAKKHDVAFHLDGARVFNTFAATGESPAEYGKYFDTISVCLSKGLGAPVGSVMLGTKEHVRKAKRIRKVMGGGWRQAGFLAAAGIYALDNNVKRLKEDHTRAQTLTACLTALPYVEEVLPAETNIVIFKLRAEEPVEKFAGYLQENQIKVSPFGKQTVRMVTHLEFDDDMLQRTLDALKKYR
jgi:threonine aldolase